MSNEAALILYASGEQVRLGDRVDFDGEPATVSEIIEIPEQLAATGMPRPCVGFITSRMGEVFQSSEDRGWEGIKLLGRQNQEI